MALALFDFPYHRVETENPESGFRGQFGGSYVFTAPPSDPDQRTFTLYFATMKFYTTGDGLIDDISNPHINMMTLINFYKEHKLYKSFQYNHPVHGLMEVKFNKPLKEPQGMVGGDGAVEPITIQLIEIP